MNIILVSSKLAKARTFTLGIPQLLLLAISGFAAFLVLTVAFNFFVLRHAASLNLPFLRDVLVSVHQQQDEKTQSYLRDSLNAMAVRVGEMQAQMLRLDTLGERLAKIAGFKPQELMFDQVPGRGGPVSTLPAQDLSLAQFGRQLESLTREMDDRSDRLGVLDSMYTIDNAKRKLLPTMLPVQGGWHSSNFGWRIDPFNGQRAFHEGVDFMAEAGTPIYAAAGGVVVYSELHPQYGNMIEIDHGNELISRYAHASKRSVKLGDVVLRGAQIGEVGRTGRATGTHLHFEVRQRGAPQNPAQFLRLRG
jgi:murein DD-endopeptidase MepM/ murein hydrolase activator NlpD